jgi:hypothetical protein
MAHFVALLLHSQLRITIALAGTLIICLPLHNMGNCFGFGGSVKKDNSPYRQDSSDGSQGSNPNEASWFRGGKRWIETVDQETNHVYYVCPSTGESRITLPPPDHDQTRV